MSIYDPPPPKCPTKDCPHVRSPTLPVCYWCAIERERAEPRDPDPVDPERSDGIPRCVHCDEPRMDGKPICERHDRANAVAAKIGRLNGGSSHPDHARLLDEYFAITGTIFATRAQLHPDED